MIIFSDFDGTIAQADVGDALFETFGEKQECARAVQLWLRDEISSRECLEREAATARLTPSRLDAFCDAQAIDPGFAGFFRFCRQQGWPLIVLSDGMDYYIHRILARHGLALPVFSNQLVFQPPDRIALRFPHFANSCGRCGNCKGYHVRRLAAPGDPVVYVGDGYSDRCGAQAADLVFARRDLARWCDQENRLYFPLENFAQVQEVLAEEHAAFTRALAGGEVQAQPR